MDNIRSPLSAFGHGLIESTWIVPAVLSALVCAISAWHSYEEYQRTLEQEYRLLEAHARIADSQLANLTRHVKQLLNLIAAERPGLTSPQLAAYATILARRKRELPEIRVLAVIDAAGRIEATANPSLAGFDASQRDYFVAHRDRVTAPKFHITRPFKSAFGDYSVAFSVAIHDSEHRFQGVAVTGVDFHFFDSIMTHIKPAGTASVTAIFNGDGDLIYHLPDPEKHVDASIRGTLPFERFIRSGQPMVRSRGVSRTDGVERIFVHRTIGDTGLGLAVAASADEVFAEWRRNQALHALTVVLATAVIFGLTWVARRHQRAAVSGRAFTEQLIETANVMLVCLDAEGRVVTFNEAAEVVSGYRRSEVIGRKWNDVAKVRALAPQVWDVFRNDREIGIVRHTVENVIRTKDGRERTVSWQNSVIYDQGVVKGTIAFGVDVTDRAQIEEVRRNEAVSRRLVGIQEEERRRLAVELHDRTSPNLSALAINLKLLADAMPRDCAGAIADLLEDTTALLDDTVASIRAISTEFRPPVLDHAGFWPALEGYARQFSLRTGITVRAQNSEPCLRLRPEIESNLFHIAQEALTNCAKHSHARAVSIGQAKHGDTIRLEIADDGTGFDPATANPGAPQRLGLLTMQKRAEFIGATFSLDSRPGRGTRVAVEFAAATTRDGEAREAQRRKSAM